MPEVELSISMGQKTLKCRSKKINKQTYSQYVTQSYLGIYQLSPKMFLFSFQVRFMKCSAYNDLA